MHCRAIPAALLILILFAAGPHLPTYGAMQPYSKHVDRQNGYSLVIPSNWKAQDTKGKFALALVCPEDANTKGIPTSLAVLAKESTASLDESAAFYLKDYQKVGTFKLLEQKKVKIGSADAVKMHFKMQLITYPPPKYDSYLFNQIVLSYVLTSGKRSYNLIFMSEDTKFERYRVMFEGIAQTFRFE